MPDQATITPETREDSPRLEVVSEPLTYRKGVELSWFKDLVRAERGDQAAKWRLARHQQEVDGEMERRDRLASAQKPDELEYRTNPNRTAGTGGYFAPPLWLIDQFATAPRAKRVLADLLPQFALPQGVQSVNVPRLTTGNQEQSVTDLTVDPSADVVDAQVNGAVVTISGHGDVSLQALDQSPAGAHLDWAFFKDLSEAYDAQLEAQLINGSGSTNGQLAGLLGIVPTANQVTYTSGSPVATALFPYLGQVVAHIGNNRKCPPEVWLMSTSRLGWLGSSEDTQNRPLMIADRDGTGALDLLAFPVCLDDAIPTNLGAASNQDAIIACRPSDGMLFESAPRAAVHFEPGSAELQARIQLHRYVAALNGRYPTAVASLQGTGMVVQSGFAT